MQLLPTQSRHFRASVSLEDIIRRRRRKRRADDRAIGPVEVLEGLGLWVEGLELGLEEEETVG